MIAQPAVHQKSLPSPDVIPLLTHQRTRTVTITGIDVDSMRVRAHFTWRLTGGRDGKCASIPCRMASIIASPVTWALSRAVRARN